MSLQCGIIGLTNVGKTTLFNCLSNTPVQTSSFSAKANLGIISVPDFRLYELEKYQKTERIVHATVEIVDIPGLTKGAVKGEGTGAKFLTDIRNTDALIHVLRCFDDPNVAHIEGNIDPIRDKELVDFELQVKDLESVEKKLQRVEKIAKTGDKDAKRILEILQLCKEHLEGMQSIRTLSLSDEDKKHLADLCLLTAKPVLYVCNVDSDSAAKENSYVEKVKKSLSSENAEVLVIAASLEAEIAELDKNDRMAFLNDAGLNEAGVDKLVRCAYSLLNLQTFFTVGPKEIRAWTIKKGMFAPEASGVIHSDLERGFIRAEVMKYNDFIHYKSENACKEAGKLHVEGKKYVVEDGDILHIRFNV